MRCPLCGHHDTRVKGSRPREGKPWQDAGWDLICSGVLPAAPVHAPPSVRSPQPNEQCAPVKPQGEIRFSVDNAPLGTRIGASVSGVAFKLDAGSGPGIPAVSKPRVGGTDFGGDPVEQMHDNIEQTLGEGLELENEPWPAAHPGAPTPAAKAATYVKIKPARSTIGDDAPLNPNDDEGLNNSSRVKDYVRKHRAEMASVSGILGIPLTSISTVLGEEYRTYSKLKDTDFDNLGLYTVMSARPPPDFGDPPLSGALDRDLTPNEFLEARYKEDLPAIRDGVLQEPSGWLGAPSKLADPLKLDIGAGNVNFGGAMDMVKQYIAAHPKGDPLDLKKYAGHYDQLYKDMIDDNSSALVKMMGLKVKQTQDFYLNNRTKVPGLAQKIRDYYNCSTEFGKDQLLDYGYRIRLSKLRDAFEAQKGEPTVELHLPMRGRGYPDYFRDRRTPYWATYDIMHGKDGS